jgi:hypothetical protein
MARSTAWANAQSTSWLVQVSRRALATTTAETCASTGILNRHFISGIYAAVVEVLAVVRRVCLSSELSLIQLQQ